MTYPDLAPACEQAAAMLIEDVRDLPANSMLYVDVQPGVITCELFKDIGHSILYGETPERVVDYIWQAWDNEGGERWRLMLYHLRDGRVSTNFLHDDEVDDEDYLGIQRERLFKRILGEKPIVYPPINPKHGKDSSE